MAAADARVVHIFSKTSLAVEELITPRSTRSISPASAGALMGLSASVSAASLSARAISPISQLAAALAGAPAPTTAANQSPTSRDRVSSVASYADKPCTAISRSRRAAGNSGSACRARSMRAGSTSTGGRSGSGKYR